MNQQPDKLFRDKLENYEKALPSAAWDRIASAQTRKKNNKVWLKIAASLLVAASAGAVWMWTQSSPVTETMATVQTTKPEPAPPVTKEVAPPIENQMPAANAATPETRATDAKKYSASKEGKGIVPSDKGAGRRRSPNAESQQAVDSPPAAAVASHNDVATRSSAPVLQPEVPDLADATQKSETQLADSSPVASTVGLQNASQGVTLTYSTKEVAAYLNKNIEDEATADDKKQSTLKKLLQKANDLKTNQDTFGELRQKKNEILALNFKNDKRGQKTRN